MTQPVDPVAFIVGLGFACLILWLILDDDDGPWPPGWC